MTDLFGDESFKSSNVLILTTKRTKSKITNQKHNKSSPGDETPERDVTYVYRFI